MRRRGDLNGVGTTIGPKDASWFSKGSTHTPPNTSAPRPPRSQAEQAEFSALKKTREQGSRLIKAGDLIRPSSVKKTKRHRTKKRTIIPEPSIPHKDQTVLVQTKGRGQSRQGAMRDFG